VNTFKRFSLIVISLLLIFSLTSCTLLEKANELNPFTKAKKAEASIEDPELNTLIDKAVMASVLAETEDIKAVGSIYTDACIAKTENDLQKVTDTYTAHLEEITENGFYVRSGDLDGDGEKEKIYTINKLSADWSGKDKLFDDDFMLEESAFSGNYLVIIYLDEYDGHTVIQTKSIPDVSATKELYIGGKDGVISLALPTGDLMVYTVDAETVISSNINNAVRYYGNYIKSIGGSEIRAMNSDICDINGDEVVFVYSIDGTYYVDMLYMNQGKLVKFHSASDNDNKAVFAVNYESNAYVMDYYQNIELISEDYQMDYSFVLYRFNSKFEMIESESLSISRLSSEPSTDEEMKFFRVFNGHLLNSVVCNDPFEISGYRTTISESEVNIDDMLIVKIANCSTAKTGIVNVPETSFLFMRTGPSKSYAQVLVNEYDPDSFIRLLKGTPVTIIDTVNTGDTENPIWLKIQVKYGDKIFVGYSSQTYIDVNDVPIVTMGSILDIDTTADIAGVTWRSNDPSIATVDENGIVSAVSPGLVMITATSDAGNSDSCLVFVHQ